MKSLLLAAVGAVVAGLLLMTGTAQARATRIEFSGIQTCVPTSPGDVTLPDGNIHIRGGTSTCTEVTPLTTTTSFSVTNMNLSAAGDGHIWGTVRIEEGGVVTFEGALQGKMSGFGSPDGRWTVRAVAHGRGALTGAQLFSTSECQPGMGGTSACTISGYILMP